ncbi:DUF885 domain-containing protein [Parvularcula oceani]|uniref:DUF885 domain-containing protein n=1 Tax=Parvularcula oceani TaxID=1247963 RepID=UPI0004E15727|nr:DUF885 domain-containing protein [Parvularcula oceani]
MKVVCILVVLLLGAFFPASAAQSGPEEAFERLYQEEWTWRQARSLGSGDVMPRHLPDVSPEAQAEKLAYWEEVQRELEAIDPSGLSRRARIDHAVYAAQIEDLIAAQRFREYEIPLNSSGGFWTGLAYMSRRPLRTEDDYRNYLTLLGEIPRYFAQQRENMEAGLARGFTPARVALQGREEMLAAIANAARPGDVVFHAPFEEMPAAIPAGRQEALRQEAAAVIEGSVIPAYRDLLAFFRDEYIPNSRQTLAASDLPDGEAYYGWKVRQYTTLDRTAGEVHAIGLEEVAAIRERMMDVMEQAGFKGSLSDFLAFLRSDARFYAETPADYLKEAAWISKQFDGVAGDYFGRLPRSRFTIEAFPPDIAPFTSGAAGGRDTYWLNTYNLSTRPLYSLRALTLHESAPGHSFQTSLAAENEARPEFRREVYISAYGEGWALYCEKLGIEMGLYETPYDMFGMLSYQMWRAARLVVDTGLHAEGWSRDQAIRYLLDNTAIGEHEITTEIDRYITNPGQALSYYTGMMAIEEAREKAEDALGGDFDIRAFHDTILDMGGVPLPVLAARIDGFIADGGRSPHAEGER